MTVCIFPRNILGSTDMHRWLCYDVPTILHTPIVRNVTVTVMVLKELHLFISVVIIYPTLPTVMKHITS